jgi:Chaperone of endosialidase
MTSVRGRWFGSVGAACALTMVTFAAPVRADEIWVAPTAQQDFGGLGVASSVVWPVSAFGATRLAWSVPDNLKALQSAKVVLIPQSPGASSLNIFVCSSKNGDLASGNCTGPSSKPFTGVPNTLMEVEIAGILAPYVGSPGASYLAVIAYTTPTTATDHILGLRFGYEPTTPAGVATLDKNTFTDTQTAPAFVGNGSGLTGLPFPAGAATLGANTFGGTQTAPAFAGSGASLTGVAKLAANTFTGTQTIDAGNLDLDASTATTGNITKNGVPFLHNFGNSNAFFGLGAGNVTMTGLSNMAAGASSLSLNTTGSDNTGSGTSALHFNSSGEGNTATGSLALQANSVGSGNTANGGSALQLNTAGNTNTAIGSHALDQNNTGSNNTAVGERALNQSIGSNNTAVGVRAGSLTTGSNNVYLGAQVSGVGGESNAMYLGKLGVQTKTVIAGVSAVGVVNAVPVFIDPNGQLGTILSSIRFKEDVHDMADVSSRLLQLRPVTFRYTQAYSDGAKPIQYGLIAEEVAEVFPELAVRDGEGRVETVHYETLNVLLVNEVQKQQRRIDALEQKVNDLLERLTQ